MSLTQWEHPAGKEERTLWHLGWELWGCGDWVWGQRCCVKPCLEKSPNMVVGGCRQEGEVQGEQRVDPLAAWVDLGRTEMVVGLSALETEGDKSWNGIRETEI